MFPWVFVLLISCTQPSGETLFSNVFAYAEPGVQTTGYQPCYETESVEVPLSAEPLSRLQLRLVSTTGPVECVWTEQVPAEARCCLPVPRDNDCISVSTGKR